MRLKPLRVLLAVAIAAAACDDSTITSPTSTAVETSQIFTGTIPVGGSAFSSYTLSVPGILELTLASVSLDSRGSTLTTPLGFGNGTPNGTGCDITSSVTSPPGLQVQMRRAIGAGTYCVRVFDAGNLTTPVNFAVRMVHLPTDPPLVSASPTTEVFESVLADRGFTAHSFVAAGAGTITATLTSVGPPSTSIGLGIGVRGATCVLNRAVTTGPGSAPQLSASVDRGVYCVQVYDVGTLTAPTRFSVTITRP
jgi:hypothetical protein